MAANEPADDNKIEKKDASRSDGDSVCKILDSRFECPICLNWLRKPMLTSCGHRFCQECIYNWLDKESCCPVDKEPLTRNTAHLFRDNYIIREMSQEKIDCLYKQYGCMVQMSPVDMDKHLEKCEFKKYALEPVVHECHFKSFGCTKHFGSVTDLESHEKTNVQDHLRMFALSKLDTASSKANPKALEAQKWDAPSKNAGGSIDASPLRNTEKSIKDLDEQIVVLRQQYHELSISLANQQAKMASLVTTISTNNEEMTLRHCNGIYLWRISSFAEKLAKMMENADLNQKTISPVYSPAFYTSPFGYKVRGRVNLSPKNPEYFSIVLHVMRSDHDDTLVWPLNVTISYALIHPENQARTMHKRAEPKPHLEAFQRPVNDFNLKSFGYSEFIKVSSINEFIKDDSLNIRFEVLEHERLPPPID